MKFKLLSDLHLEFYRQNEDRFEPKPEADDKDTVLLLAGDIHVGTKAKNWIRDRTEQYKHVFYILGNHEFYGQEWFTTKNYWKNKKLNNFTFLDDDVAYLDDVRILGGTLWTLLVGDLTKETEFRINNAGYMMNDYHKVRIHTGDYDMYATGKRNLRPTDTRLAHIETVKFLKEELAKPFDGKTIVMTHHLPSEKCVDPMFKGHNLNPFYMTNLEYLMEGVDVWVHGHTHVNVDDVVGGTRILCNPMGYHGYEINPTFNEGLTFGC